MSLAWGGYANGRIPAAALHVVPQFKPLGDGWSSTAHASNVMKAAGAIQLSAMQRDFYRAFEVKLYVREAYRNMAGQSFYRKRMENREPGWTLAALPGTSVHGWALSVDLGVGEANANPSGQYLAWLRANAARYGFRNDVPTEVWHWSFLLTPTSGVTSYINNPSATAADLIPTEDEMSGVRLIRNNTKGDKRFGEVWAICVETGFAYHIPGGYLGEWETRYQEHEEHAANFFGYWLDRVEESRKRLAAGVWGHPITGWNGETTAERRLVGADKKADSLAAGSVQAVADAVAKAIPAGTGGTVVNGAPVDVSALAEAVTKKLTPAIVKAVGDDLAARLKA